MYTDSLISEALEVSDRLARVAPERGWKECLGKGERRGWIWKNFGMGRRFRSSHGR